MLFCENSRKVSAYHDGELSGDERRLMEEHLGRCASCARELEQLRSLSRLLAAATMPEMPVSARERLSRTVGDVPSTSP